ncbi:uncharacterized protein LOC111029131, partial [Myzus persicae]|uniref:uncharacterized protein LOC111029131 n=1 Tax=Myzus persicae TaxID=13164 RepID=UPI000B93695F
MSILKRKATTDLNVKPNKLIRQELRNCPKSEHLSHSDVRLFRKSMYAARRKIFPKISKSLFEAKAMIFQNKKDFVSNNELFCFMDSENSIPIFTNATNMSLLNSSKHVFADGTFSYAPKYFLQMYTIHVYLNGFYVTIIFVFMDSKTQKSCTDVRLKIKELYFKFQGQQLQLKMIHLDFEKAAHNAVLEVFENCQVVGCRFHLSQAWFRCIKNYKELNKHYAGKTVVYQWLQSFFALSYLPSNEVNDGFVYLMANAPPNVEHFTDYIVDTFIDENSLFPPHFWA